MFDDNGPFQKYGSHLNCIVSKSYCSMLGGGGGGGAGVGQISMYSPSELAIIVI